MFLYKEIKVQDASSHEELGIFEEKVRKYSLDDFRGFMQHAGLNIVATFGNYHLDAYIPESAERLIIVAQKHSNSQYL